MNLLTAVARPLLTLIRLVEALAPLADLGLRLWVARVFFQSGQSKYASFDSTVLLFTYEYQVPLLEPRTAAIMATAAELVLPALLVAGLAGRFAAAGLFILNIVAVLSYPALHEAGLINHQVWGLMLLVTLLHGPGRLSVDHWIRRWAERQAGT